MRKTIVINVCIAVFIIMAMTACSKSTSSVEKPVTELPDSSVQIVKTYRFDLNDDIEGKITESFDENGYQYVRTDSISTEITVEDVQEVSVQKSLSAPHRLRTADFSQTIEYEQDGYVGTLTRNDGTFSVGGTGTKNVSKNVTATKKYTGLVRNDMSAIDKVHNGMPLISVDWYDQNTGQSVRGYTQGLPGPYSAVAYYRGVQTTKVTIGYAAKVTYTGTVIKKTVTGTEAKVTYTGTPIPKSKDLKQSNMTMPYIIGGSLLALCVLVGIGLIFMNRRKGVVRR